MDYHEATGECTCSRYEVGVDATERSRVDQSCESDGAQGALPVDSGVLQRYKKSSGIEHEVRSVLMPQSRRAPRRSLKAASARVAHPCCVTLPASVKRCSGLHTKIVVLYVPYTGP